MAEAVTRQDAPSQGVSPETTTRRKLTSDEDEVVHVVCCRDPKWERAYCGMDMRDANVNAAGDWCAMCVEAWHQMCAARGDVAREDFCPVDGRQCPDMAWLFERIASETS